MNKQKQMWAGAAAIVVVGVLLYALWPAAIEAPGNGTPSINNTNDKEEPFVKAPSAPPRTPAPAAAPAAPRAGLYAPYSTDRVANASKGPVVLFFNSASCASCKALDADIRAHALSIPKDVTILEVDFDANTELKQKYGVKEAHLMIQVDVQGNRITQWARSATLSDIATRVVRF